MIAAKIGENLYIETYAPTSCRPTEERETYYAGLIAFIQRAQQSHPKISMILMGDCNAHIEGFYAEATDSSGHMLKNLASRCNLMITPND